MVDFSLFKYFKSLSDLTDSELSDFAQGLTLKEYSRNHLFTEIGQTKDKIGFVKSGVFKVYYLTQAGKQIIRNFCSEGKPIGSYATILTGRPAHVNIEAIEDSQVVETTYSYLAKFYQRNAQWEKLGRRIAELHYISRESREHQFLTLDAKGRYQAFRENFPGLELRVSQADVASYIGVDPATLSRLRKNQ